MIIVHGKPSISLFGASNVPRQSPDNGNDTFARGFFNRGPVKGPNPTRLIIM